MSIADARPDAVLAAPLDAVESATPLAGAADEVRRLHRWRWRVLGATMFCYLFYYTGRQTFGFAIPGIQAELGLSKSTLGWVSTAMLWSYAIGQAINGNLGDRFGGRRLVSAGAALSCALNWVVSFAGGFGTLAAGWSANGFAQSMGWAPGSRVLSNWWPSTARGRAYGFYVFAAGLASVVAYATSTWVLHAGLGWRWIFRLPVLLMLVGGLAYYLLVRDRPADAGFADEDADLSATAGPTATGAADPAATTILEYRPAERSIDRYRAVLSDWRFLLTGLALGFQSSARYGLLIWVPVYFLGSHWKDNPAGPWITVALPVGMALGAVASGWISDNLFASNRSRPIAIFLALAAASTMALFAVGRSHPALVMPLLFLSGFFVYGPQAPFWALCPDLLGKERAGTGTGVLNTFAYAFAGLCEPLIGYVVQRGQDDASLVFPIVAAACGCGCLLALLIRR